MNNRSPQPAKNRAIPVAVFVALFLVLGGLVGIFVSRGKLFAEREISGRSETKNVDVDDLQRGEGCSKCDQGLALIQKHAGALGADAAIAPLAPEVKDLVRGKNLIEEGLNLISRADHGSGPCYDMKKHQEALKMARKKLAELQE